MAVDKSWCVVAAVNEKEKLWSRVQTGSAWAPCCVAIIDRTLCSFEVAHAHVVSVAGAFYGLWEVLMLRSEAGVLCG